MSLRPTDPRNPPPSTLQVRRVMEANRPTDTWPERLVRGALARQGIRGYRLNYRVIGVRPDISFTRVKVAVFVHGCFWHGHRCIKQTPKRNRAFWQAKFAANRARDRRRRRDLVRAGWAVFEIRECELHDLEPFVLALKREVDLRRARIGGVRNWLGLLQVERKIAAGQVSVA